MRAKQIKEKGDTIAIDFDGVIHSYVSGWTGDIPKDPPIRGIEKALMELKRKGYILKIFSTRKSRYIEQWLKKYGLDIYFSGIHNTKIPAKMYIDDRGLHFSSWDQTLKDIDNFKVG